MKVDSSAPITKLYIFTEAWMSGELELGRPTLYKDRTVILNMRLIQKESHRMN